MSGYVWLGQVRADYINLNQVSSGKSCKFMLVQVVRLVQVMSGYVRLGLVKSGYVSIRHVSTG